jgi:hypothetical protein
MKRFLWFKKGPAQPPAALNLTNEQHQQLLDLLSEIGLGIIRDARGPVPLLTFGRRVMERLETHKTHVLPLPQFADALKRIIRDMRHDRLRVMSPTDFVGVGYVYNAQDPDTWPVRTSR